MPDIHMLWGIRESDPTSPELMEAWDEYSVDGYPQGWEAVKAKAIESWGDDLLRAEEIRTHVDYELLMRIMNPGTPKIDSTGLIPVENLRGL